MAIIKVHVENALYQGIQVLKDNRNKRHKRRAFFVEGVRNVDAAARYGWRFEAFITGSADAGAGSGAGAGADAGAGSGASAGVDSSMGVDSEAGMGVDSGAGIGIRAGVSASVGGLSGWANEMLASHPDVDIYELTPKLMNKLSAKSEASELAAIVRMRDGVYSEGVELNNIDPIYVLSDRPSGKGNLGTLIRSCDAFGVTALFRTGHSVDFYDPEVVAASMGSLFAVPFFALSSSSELDDLIVRLRRVYPGIQIIGTSAHAEQPIYEIDLIGPVIFLIGNEADGLSWRLKQIADILVTIPMNENAFASSLNISCAATTLLYEASRQRMIKTKFEQVESNNE